MFGILAKFFRFSGRENGNKFKLSIVIGLMNLIIKGKHKKTLIFPVFSGDSVLYSDSCLVVIWVL